ncbi:hypothetical protein Taro_047432 [Colocasia esculenta]|uniref:Uncharacterized protein n=1 Tax=Colocasia esculenta TaxID=4460 RepID=A0A843X5F3_COLES|nr:hypothetical protein [Colocasia esculenta]
MAVPKKGECLLLLLGVRVVSVVAIFPRVAVGFVLGLRVRVGVSRRLREPACGVAFTGAGLLPVGLVEGSYLVGCPLAVGRYGDGSQNGSWRLGWRSSPSCLVFVLAVAALFLKR